jgi:RNA polymerase sigma-70 factor (ECF subfamily)
MAEYADHLSDSFSGVTDELDAEFERLLIDSSTLAFRVAYGVLHHREDAEDAAQDAFIKAHRHFKRIRSRESFRAWLVRTTWRLAIDRQRANRRREIRHQEHGRSTVTVTAGDPVLDNERAAHLWRAIDILPDKLRLAVVLSGIEGHTVHDVARLLGVPEGTVKSRLFLARERMKERLQWTTNNLSR